MNAGALTRPYGVSVTTSWNFSVVDAAKCGATNVGLVAVLLDRVTSVGSPTDSGALVDGSTWVHCRVIVSPSMSDDAVLFRVTVALAALFVWAAPASATGAVLSMRWMTTTSGSLSRPGPSVTKSRK